jgi:transposase
VAKRTHSPEFKREAVRLSQQAGVSRTKLARELGIHPNVLRAWVEKFESGTWEAKPGEALKSAETQEVEKLRRELTRVKMERDILKKALAYFAKEPS